MGFRSAFLALLATLLFIGAFTPLCNATACGQRRKLSDTGVIVVPSVAPVLSSPGNFGKPMAVQPVGSPSQVVDAMHEPAPLPPKSPANVNLEREPKLPNPAQTEQPTEQVTKQVVNRLVNRLLKNEKTLKALREPEIPYTLDDWLLIFKAAIEHRLESVNGTFMRSNDALSSTLTAFSKKCGSTKILKDEMFGDFDMPVDLARNSLDIAVFERAQKEFNEWEKRSVEWRKEYEWCKQKLDHARKHNISLVGVHAIKLPPAPRLMWETILGSSNATKTEVHRMITDSKQNTEEGIEQKFQLEAGKRIITIGKIHSSLKGKGAAHQRT